MPIIKKVLNRVIVEIALAMVAIGSVTDAFTYGNNWFFKVFRCFSMVRNIKTLFKVSSINKNREHKFEFLHGLRFFGILWVIVAHTTGFCPVTILSKVSPFARYPEELIVNSRDG